MIIGLLFYLNRNQIILIAHVKSYVQTMTASPPVIMDSTTTGNLVHLEEYVDSNPNPKWN